VLQHVGIEIRPRDVERAVEFFELLGFERVEPPPALAEDFTWLEREGTQVHLMHEDHPTVPGRAHLAVVAPDLDATVARLRKRGFETRPGRQHWGAPRVHTIAPGGHQVELIAAAPPGGAAPRP
jgi:catechol 2,3-dioxygenase-like lactoylglutathione lyase family enzyme